MNALRNYAEYQAEKKEKIRQSFEYYRFSLMSKALETIKWFHETSQDKKNKIEFMQVQRNERYYRIVFETIRQKTIHLRQFRVRLNKVTDNHSSLLKSTFFRIWLKKYTKKRAN